MDVKNNKVNLCDSCCNDYPACPVDKDGILFGDGIGNDNICCCNCYKPEPEGAE